MLGISLKHHGRELIALPHTVEAYADGKLTGIPLMHPWANRLRSHQYTASGQTIEVPTTVPTDNNGLPMHGMMHGKPFTTVSRSSDALATTFAFTEAAHLAQFPFPHRIDIGASITSAPTRHSLTISTAITNLGDNPMPISFGWHPYLVAPDAPRAAWHLRLPASERHVLDDHLLPTGETTQFEHFDEAIAASTFDDHFALGDDRRFAVTTAKFAIEIDFDEHYPHAQVYVPPDLGDGLRNFVCIEPMTAPSNALGDGLTPMLPGNETFTAAFTITVS